MYDDEMMPGGIDDIIRALCADYLRRSQVITFRDAPYNVIMEYRFLNYRMMNAAVEIAGTRDAMQFIHDIGNSVGYAHSSLILLPEKIYKDRKMGVKSNIAKRLSLM